MSGKKLPPDRQKLAARFRSLRKKAGNSAILPSGTRIAPGMPTACPLQ
jgi:hypothetical protein